MPDKLKKEETKSKKKSTETAKGAETKVDAAATTEPKVETGSAAEKAATENPATGGGPAEAQLQLALEEVTKNTPEKKIEEKTEGKGEEKMEEGAETAAQERAEVARAGKKRNARHERLKAKVFKVEQKNYDKLIAFASRNNWFKLGGHSALIYYHRLAKRMGLNPRLNPDTDFFSKFKEGIISIRNVETLEKNLAKLKIRRNTDLTIPGELYVFDLGYKISEEDMKLMYQDEKIRREKLNQMTLPKVMFPDLHATIWTVTRMWQKEFTNMSVVNRQMIGEAANNEVLRMQKCYFLMANGNMEVDRAMKEILIAEEEVKCFAKMGAELKIMAFDGVLRMTEELAKIETLVRKIIREGGEE